MTRDEEATMAEMYGTNGCGELTCWPAHQLNREVEIGKARREAVAKWRGNPTEPLEPYHERKLTPDEEALVRYGKAWESALSVLFGGGR